MQTSSLKLQVKNLCLALQPPEIKSYRKQYGPTAKCMGTIELMSPHILAAMSDMKPIKSKDLSTKLGMSINTVAAVLRALEKQKLVVREAMNVRATNWCRI